MRHLVNPTRTQSHSILLAVLSALALLAFAVGCSDPPSPTPAVGGKIARPVSDTPLPSATARPSATATPTLTATATSLPTETATVPPTVTPTAVPVNPYAVRSTVGGAKRIPRDAIFQVRSPEPLEVSPALFGLSYWVPPFGGKVIGAFRALNFSTIRWGGENMELEAVKWSDLDRFILDARAMNLEPLIQVPYRIRDPEFAAEMVRYVNVEKKYDVRLWSIGNEEDRNLRGGALDKWIHSWRSYRDAMKAVDPRILMVGPDYSYAYDYNNPANDWLTPFLQVNGDALDIVSLHYYPFGGTQSNPTVLVGNALGIGRMVQGMRAHIRAVTGRDIPLAYTELNLSHNWRTMGEGSSASFSAGLWLAETLGQMAEAGVWMVNIWSGRGSDSTAMVEKLAETKRPTYYAAQMYANFGARLIPLASHAANITAHAARRSDTGVVSIVLVNRAKVPSSFNLVLNSGEEQTMGNVYFDLNSRRRIPFNLPAQSMASLTLGPNLKLQRAVIFSREMYDSGQGPQEQK